MTEHARLGLSINPGVSSVSRKIPSSYYSTLDDTPTWIRLWNEAGLTGLDLEPSIVVRAARHCPATVMDKACASLDHIYGQCQSRYVSHLLRPLCAPHRRVFSHLLSPQKADVSGQLRSPAYRFSLVSQH